MLSSVPMRRSPVARAVPPKPSAARKDATALLPTNSRRLHIGLRALSCVFSMIPSLHSPAARTDLKAKAEPSRRARPRGVLLRLEVDPERELRRSRTIGDGAVLLRVSERRGVY